MATKLSSNSRWEIKILFLSLLACITSFAAGADDEKIVLRVVGPDGKPLAKAKIYQYYALHYNQQHGTEYVCDDNGVVELSEKKLFQNRMPVSLYGLYEDKLAGFTDLNPDDPGSEIRMTLTPACRVTGTIKSTDLVEMGQKLELSNVFLYRGQDRLMSYADTQCRFVFLIPAGEYTIRFTGKRIQDFFENITLPPGQKELQFNYDVHADLLANLLGKQAPELTQLKGWLNSDPVKLSGLKGKVVLLDFFRTCCQNGAGPMPKLKDLYEKYRDKGLVIIAVHADWLDSTEDVDIRIAYLSKKYWNNIELPFPVALDGGGDCKIEGTAKSAEGATTAAYGVLQWPTMVLIDKQGKIVKEFDIYKDTPLLEELLNR
jgi:thiol-disulfide isomerase/thioredoxin